LFGQDGDGGHGHEGLKAERPQPRQDRTEPGGLGDRVQDVERQGGAVGEHGEGAQPAGHLDGAVDAVAVLGSMGSHGRSFLVCWARDGPGHQRSGAIGCELTLNSVLGNGWRRRSAAGLWSFHTDRRPVGSARS
jgi:hypothetical protein